MYVSLSSIIKETIYGASANWIYNYIQRKPAGVNNFIICNQTDNLIVDSVLTIILIVKIYFLNSGDCDISIIYRDSYQSCGNTMLVRIYLSILYMNFLFTSYPKMISDNVITYDLWDNIMYPCKHLRQVKYHGISLFTTSSWKLMA